MMLLSISEPFGHWSHPVPLNVLKFVPHFAVSNVVGLAVGTNVGVDGMPVGTRVGFPVGLVAAVGLLEGLVGRGVGAVLGLDVGAAVVSTQNSKAMCPDL